MNILSFLENPALAGVLLTLAVQSILISFLGIAFLLLLRKRPAPVRSLVSFGAIAAMFLIFGVSVGFRVSGISWQNANHLRISANYSQSVPSPVSDSADETLHSDSNPLLPQARVDERSIPRTSATYSTTARTIRIVNSIGLVWVAGILFSLFKLGYGLIFLKGFRFGLIKVEDNKFEGLVKTVVFFFKQKQAPELYVSPRVESPVTIGLWNPIVIIPMQLYASLNRNEMKSILIHELAHIYHRDHVVGVLKRIVSALYWWNPMSYWLNLEHDAAREEVSDNYVLRELNPKEYSECLASLAEKVCLISELPGAAAMAGRHFRLAMRVESILSQNRNRALRANRSLKLLIFATNISAILAIAGFQGQIHIARAAVILAAPAIAVEIANASANTVAIPSRPTEAVDNPGNSVNASNGAKEILSEARRLQSDGSRLSEYQAIELEQKVAQDPHDIIARSLLISYYGRRGLYDRSYYAKHNESMAWLTQNHPEAAILCLNRLAPAAGPSSSEIQDLWQKQLQQKPGNVAVLWNAGNYLMTLNIDTAIECFKKGRNLDPQSADLWDSKLGMANQMKIARSPKDTFKSLEAANAESAPITGGRLLTLGRAALAAGESEKAADYANKMLAAGQDNNDKSDYPYNYEKGDFIYYGHSILGMLAVQKGDLDEAERQLLASGDTPGSPTLKAAPNMSLVKELLDRGRKEAVLQFLRKCQKFWFNKSQSDRWIQQIEQGQTPSFGLTVAW
jgi:beta-lactamase regulating signal transducer with metallopeptidase domain